METRANFLLIGAVTLAGFIGLLAFLMWFAKVEFDRQFDYYDVYFEEVSGLTTASEVRFAGLPVGQVLGMALADDQSGRVRVRIEVNEGTPIREDSRASLELQGVTGVAIVGISAGNPTSAMLADSGQAIPVIPSSRSALQSLTDKGPEMIDRLNEVAKQLTILFGEENQQRVENILVNVERSTQNLDQAIADISSATGAIAGVATEISGFGENIAGLSDAATETLAKADTALESFTTTADSAKQTLEVVSDAVETARTYISGDLQVATTGITGAAGNISKLAERAEASMGGLDATIKAARGGFESAEKILGTDIGPAVADLREGVGRFNTALDRVTADMPTITQSLRSAAGSAETAFDSLRSMLDGARGPVQSFTRDGLAQFSQVARDARELVNNLNQLVSALRRNPSQVITGPRQPEFRR